MSPITLDALGWCRAGPQETANYSRRLPSPDMGRDLDLRATGPRLLWQGTGVVSKAPTSRVKSQTHFFFKENKFYFYNQNVLIKILLITLATFIFWALALYQACREVLAHVGQPPEASRFPEVGRKECPQCPRLCGPPSQSPPPISSARLPLGSLPPLPL